MNETAASRIDMRSTPRPQQSEAGQQRARQARLQHVLTSNMMRMLLSAAVEHGEALEYETDEHIVTITVQPK